MSETYRIVRRFQDCVPNEVMERGLTLEEAKAHCSSPATRGECVHTGKWFDSYEVEQ